MGIFDSEYFPIEVPVEESADLIFHLTLDQTKICSQLTVSTDLTSSNSEDITLYVSLPFYNQKGQIMVPETYTPIKNTDTWFSLLPSWMGMRNSRFSAGQRLFTSIQYNLNDVETEARELLDQIFLQGIDVTTIGSHKKMAVQYDTISNSIGELLEVKTEFDFLNINWHRYQKERPTDIYYQSNDIIFFRFINGAYNSATINNTIDITITSLIPDSYLNIYASMFGLSKHSWETIPEFKNRLSFFIKRRGITTNRLLIGLLGEFGNGVELNEEDAKEEFNWNNIVWDRTRI